MSQYVIYCRKSSESEERQVLSIEAQIKELEELAKRQNLDIEKVMTESQSAKYPGRPFFNDMMKAVYKGKLKGVICWKLDRLARNPLDGSSLVWALDQGLISEIITPHGCYKNNSNDKFLMQLEFGMAKKYVDDLSDNVKRGNRAKLERGWLPGQPPLGYMNEPRERTIVRDPERFLMVRKMWDLLLEGVPVSRIIAIANKEWGFRTRRTRKNGGKPLCASILYKTFKTPFYYGLITRREGAFQGRHEPMIKEEEYWKAQEILGRKGIPRPKEHYFPFTGMIKCAECGCMITAEEKTNRYGYHYTYYRCTKKKVDIRCGQKYINSKELEKQIIGYLEKIKITDDFFDLAIEQLKDESREEVNKRQDIRKSLEKAYADCQRKLENLNQMRLSDLIGDEEYMREKQKLLIRKIGYEEKLKDRGYIEKRFMEKTERAFILARDAMNRFRISPPEEKKKIIEEIGSNFSLKDRKLLIQVEKPFLIIEDGLKRVNEKIGPLEPQDLGLSERKNEVPSDVISMWWTVVDDVRTFYKENCPDAH